MFSGCASSDNGGDDRGGGATSKGGSTSNAGSGGASGGSTASKGGSGGASGGTGGAAPAACATEKAVTGGVISDFEGTAATFMGTELNGGFYAYGDPAGGTTDPDTSTPPTMLVPTAGDHDGNALHYTGTGFPAASWGAGFGVWMECADAAAVDGISFWAKNDQPMRVGATIPGTQAVADNGSCTANCMPNSFTVPVNEDWTLVEIAWADFTGGTVPFTPDQLLGIDILIPTPAPAAGEWGFDVSIDSLSWLGGEAPSGGAGGGGPVGGAGGEPGGGGAGGG